MKAFVLLSAAVLTLAAASVQAEEVVNLYSSRHYQTDEELYGNFTKATGIKVNRIEGKGPALIERIKSEGKNSPADVFITVDAGNLWRADQAGLFQVVESETLESRIPANLRQPDGRWFGFATRGRLIFFDKAKVKAGDIKNYADLADPKWKGKVCIRRASSIYNQSLLASIIAHEGSQAAEKWAKGVVANFARKPVKGDINQLRGIGSGECVIAVANSYYFGRLQSAPKDSDRGLADKIGFVFPNQDGRGTHVNVSGGGVVATAPNKENAIKFLEYLASDSAQSHFANGNNEFPAVEGVAPSAVVSSWGPFKVDKINVDAYGKNQAEAQKIFDRVGWE